MQKGLIVIGYQGIGKTSISGVENGVIDLESSSFKHPDGTRVHNWFQQYCKIAVNLASQGFIVCTSSHKCVCDEFEKLIDEDKYDIIVVCPTIDMKEVWLARLAKRLGNDPTEKNWIAYKNAEQNYESSIKDLDRIFFTNIYISNVDYNLKNILDIYKKFIDKI